jgi:ribosomal protein S27AE
MIEHEDDAEDDSIDDWEDPDPSDQDRDDEPDEIECPRCGGSLIEIADFCPHCGSGISEADHRAAANRLRKWLVVMLLVVMLSGLIYFLLS